MSFAFRLNSQAPEQNSTCLAERVEACRAVQCDGVTAASRQVTERKLITYCAALPKESNDLMREIAGLCLRS